MSTVIDGTDREFGCRSSSSYSSIGRDSEDEESGENEAESPDKGPLDKMESLEEILPIRIGISKFYKGESKSFTNLAESESSTMKDLGMSQNAYSRRWRNLLRHRINSRGRISKKPLKTPFTLASKSPWNPKHTPPGHTEGNFDSPRNLHNTID